MFAHTVSHRTNSIKSRPMSWMMAIPEYYDEIPIPAESSSSMSRTPSTSSSGSTTSVSPPSSRATSIMMHQQYNDSEATIANDVLILQLGKDSKLDFDESSSLSPPTTTSPNSVGLGRPLSMTLEHPILSLPTSAPPTALPPPSAYLHIADQNPWALDADNDGAESIYDFSSSVSGGSPVSPVSLAVPAVPQRNSSRRPNDGNSLARSRSTSSKFSQRTSRSTTSSLVTTVGGPRTKYSTRLIVQKGRVGIA